MRSSWKRSARVLCFVAVILQLAAGVSLVSAQPSAMQVDESVRVPVLQPTEKALSYYRSVNLLWFVNLAWGVAVPLAFLSTGLSATLRNWASRIERQWFFIIGIYFLLFTAINFMVDLPLSY
jgi:STE24 endopeptidase